MVYLNSTLNLYKNGDGYDNRKYVSIFLKCLNPEFNKPNGTWVNAVIFIRNCNKASDCYCYDGKYICEYFIIYINRINK